MEIVFLVIGVAVGVVIGWLVQRGKSKAAEVTGAQNLAKAEQEFMTQLASADKEKSLAEQQTNSLKLDLEESKKVLNAERDKNEILNRNLAEAQTDLRNMQERLENQAKELEQLQKKFTTEFENIAGKILKENSKEFTTVNQKNISDILNPLKEKIQLFEKKVEDTYEKGLKDQTDLKAELKKLQDLNLKISTDAQNLTQALKGDVKKQGNWGEIVLERVLERSGLTEGQEFEREVVDTNMEGKTIRPDVIVHLPDKKHLIIDSKVSLVAYERLVNATTDEEREKAMKEHLLSLRSHVKTLSEKHYPSAKNLNAPDFVLLFLPIESSFSIAVQQDQDLFGYAWDNKVVIVSPSTLLASLRTIASIWRQENQTRNALDIAQQSGALYDKFVNFIADLEKIGKGLDSARDNYDKAMNKLHTGRGNLVRTAEKIRVLGAKAQKEIPDKFITDDALPE
ncbi:DNA recombination protein RmuC [Prolixibacter denitrificans]|uniref:DNA recombination protein RmuC n=1 Tax=Prolixibacter denitrificans TaxID=1541063 RepID=A0A2P8CKS5_9BACT|nr:DNA recombination protein RmuC [Prolixibacter denitrificans]PSK85555.1 DNA recombination protein RmuC [Prolixibacter denitrificans]GET20175.1 DNA recombination protein RmuC [Prolixibacter denitrificans]